MGERTGLVIVNTGNGKGKSTAALGLAMRALGNGMKVVMVQFIKGAWKVGEYESARKLGFEIRPMGEGFTWVTKDRERDMKVAREAWEFAKKRILAGADDMVILDEINYAIDYGYVDLPEVLETLRTRPKDVHVVLTGRKAKPELIEGADLATEMVELKHPYKKGIKAQRGIEF
ncbi:MAG TPA: cob(I)yrinic acid a,c-diamide adenosyltransferase [Planctomycetota bacterium]|nr:cob(I)yrinic acid a,c-diamide adenosyltransferase [Planctomycetota bacterium]